VALGSITEEQPIFLMGQLEESVEMEIRFAQ